MAISDLNWIVPIAAVLGIVGQWGVGAFYAGRMDERVRGQGFEIRDLKDKQRETDSTLVEHEGRISHIEGQKGFPRGGSH